MNYAEWEKGLPRDVTGDTLWKIEAYRLGLFAGYLAWEDVSKLVRDRRTLELTGQLYDAVGSVGAHIVGPGSLIDKHSISRRNHRSRDNHVARST